MAFRQVARSRAVSGFLPGIFDQAVREFGYVMYWSSAELCPCRSNSQTDQIDPTCVSCDGSGFIYMLPTSDSLCAPAGAGAACPPLVDRVDARITQAIVTQQTNDPQVYEKMGEWIFGLSGLTTFSFNELGYRDRFEHTDALMTYRQVIAVGESKLVIRGNDARTRLRYRVEKLLRVVKLVDDVVTDLTEAAVVKTDGTLDLTACTVDPGEYVSISYRTHPIWIVTEFPIVVRDTRTRTKTQHQAQGDPSTLPVHAFAKLDFLLGPTPP